MHLFANANKENHHPFRRLKMLKQRHVSFRVWAVTDFRRIGASKGCAPRISHTNSDPDIFWQVSRREAVKMMNAAISLNWRNRFFFAFSLVAFHVRRTVFLTSASPCSIIQQDSPFHIVASNIQNACERTSELRCSPIGLHQWQPQPAPSPVAAQMGLSRRFLDGTVKNSLTHEEW